MKLGNSDAEWRSDDVHMNNHFRDVQRCYIYIYATVLFINFKMSKVSIILHDYVCKMSLF